MECHGLEQGIEEGTGHCWVCFIRGCLCWTPEDIRLIYSLDEEASLIEELKAIGHLS